MLLRLPDSWPTTVVAVLAMTVLAVLDLAGSIAAKEAVVRRSPLIGLVGVLLFVVLFWVYASSLQYAELAPVTLGWIVILQVGVVLVDRWRYGTPFGVWKVVAISVIVIAQCFLLLAPDGTKPPTIETPAAQGPAGPAADEEPSDGGAWSETIVSGPHIAPGSRAAAQRRSPVGAQRRASGELEPAGH